MVAAVMPARDLLKGLPPLTPAAPLAKRLGGSNKMLIRWAAQGLFPRPIKIGKRKRFKTSDVAAYLDAMEREAVVVA